MISYLRANQGWKRHRSSILYRTYAGSMDIGVIRKTSVRYKEEQDCYNYGKKGHLVRQYQISKKEGSNWKPVPNTRIAKAIITTISMPETKTLAIIEHKVIWAEVV